MPTGNPICGRRWQANNTCKPDIPRHASAGAIEFQALMGNRKRHVASAGENLRSRPRFGTATRTRRSGCSPLVAVVIQTFTPECANHVVGSQNRIKTNREVMNVLADSEIEGPWTVGRKPAPAILTKLRQDYGVRSSAAYSGLNLLWSQPKSRDLCGFAPRIPMVQPTQPRNRNYGATLGGRCSTARRFGASFSRES